MKSSPDLIAELDKLNDHIELVIMELQARQRGASGDIGM